MAHYGIVAMGIDADVGVVGEAPIHHIGENTMGIRQAADAMHHVIGQGVFQPATVVDPGVCWFRRRDKCEDSNIYNNLPSKSPGEKSNTMNTTKESRLSLGKNG